MNGLFIGILCLACGGLGFGFKNIIEFFHSLTTQSKFEKEQQKIIADLKEKKNQFDEKNNLYREKIYEVDNLCSKYDNLLISSKESYEDKLSQLKKDYAKKEEELRKNELKKLDQIEKTNQELLLKKQEELTSEIGKLEKEKENEKEEIERNFCLWKENTNTQKATLSDELEALKQRQAEITERFKKDEQVRIERDFYRINIEEKEQEDVKSLKSLAEKLNSPIVLYKLIWENYYKNAFSTMCGRVIGKENKVGIYKITNIVNEKSYIGQTKQEFSARWRTHIKRGLRAEPTTNNKLYADMWKYGPENFTFEILTICSPEKLNETERYYIDFYDSKNYGYNITGGNK